MESRADLKKNATVPALAERKRLQIDVILGVYVLAAHNVTFRYVCSQESAE